MDQNVNESDYKLIQIVERFTLWGKVSNAELKFCIKWFRDFQRLFKEACGCPPQLWLFINWVDSIEQRMFIEFQRRKREYERTRSSSG